tara:strand:- start:350 stop:523 length:174 start_codon:yes stop_codon:yes gene_type:complete
MSKYHKKLKQEIRMTKLATAGLRRIRKEMEAELEESRLEDLVNAHIEQMEETNNWSK